MQDNLSNKYPLVSIFCFCKNRMKTIRRCIDSIVAQDYPNIEIIVQDGASTDGTLEILQEYGNGIKLVSEPDSGPQDGFFRALTRVKGEFFGSCLSDEELLPHAVSWAVENLMKYPETAAIYGDFCLMEFDGNIIRKKHTPSKWDYEKYLCSETTPPFCSSFFRRACYEALDFREYTAADEFDFWINLGARFPIRYVPGLVSKYAVHTGQSGSQKDLPEKRFASRKSAIEKLCNNPQTPKLIRLLRDKAIAGLYSWLAIYNCKIGEWDLAKKNAPEAFRVGPNSEKLHELAEVLYRHSTELYHKGQLEQALEYLDLVSQSKFVFKDINGRRACILFKLGRIKEAVKASYEELKLQPDHVRAKAIIRMAQSCPEGIAQLSNDKLAKELFKTGIKYLSQGDAIEAIKHFEEAIVDCASLPDLHYAIATAYTQLGDTPSAIKACETELKLQPEHSGVKQLLGQIEKAIAENNQVVSAERELFRELMRESETTNAISNITSCKAGSFKEPRFSFIMIVLNGMPFIEYSLKSVYEFAHEIIIVEGAVEKCMFAANPDGSSTDGTVEFIKSFPDRQNKINLIQGKWPEKCEMQNEALKYVNGDYVWLIDSDEVYKRQDLERIQEILKADPSITQVNFIQDSFWKGLDYIFVSQKFFEKGYHSRRIFKHVPGATFTTHRPPTMIWPGSDKTTEQMHLLDGTTTRQMGIIFYHYSYVLDKQVRQKIELYNRYNWGKNWNIDLLEWYNECFMKWTPVNREQIDSKYPIWTGDINSQTLPFEGSHPQVMAEYIVKRSIINSNTSTPQLVMQHVIIAIDEIKKRFKNEQITAIETGTIRSYNENHLSTYYISRTLRNRGRLTSVDISTNSIRRSRNICCHASNIDFVQSDSVQYLNTLRNHRFHFAFLDSVNNKDIIFEEFRRVIPFMVEGGILMVDDAGITKDGHAIDESVDAQKGHMVWQFLRACGVQHSLFDTPNRHGTQLKVILTSDNLAKIKQSLPKFNSQAKHSNPLVNTSGALDIREEQILKAQTLLNQGHIIKALKELDDVLNLSPDDVDAHFGRAVCLARLGRLLEAEVEAKNSLSKDPKNPRLSQFVEQIRKLKPNLTGDREIEWGFIKSQIEKIAKIQRRGAKLLDFGCGQTAELTHLAANMGYQITAIDMMPLTVSLDSTYKIRFIQGDFLHQDWMPKSFDMIINCSSIEHSGLVGRYGVVEQGPDDDLEIIARMSKLIKPDGKMLLTIPVGLDKVVGSLHRVYGQTRLANLLDGWEVQSSCFWVKDENNQWREVDEESALQREPMLAYGLGCFVLRPALRLTATSDSTVPPIYDQKPIMFDRGEDKTAVNVTVPEASISATSKLRTKVLIVKTDGIGDFVIFSGSLPYYRKLYPDSHISIVVREYSVELAEACPYIDEVIINHRKSMVYDQNYAAEFIKRLRAAKFDVALCPIYSRDKVTDFIMINSGAREKFVSAGNDSNMPLEQIQANNPYFTSIVPARAGNISEVDRNKEFLEGLGVVINQPYKTTVWMEQEDKDFADGLLKELNIEKPIVVCSSALYAYKNWTLQKWAKLISNYKDHPFVICGSDKDAKEAENLITLTNHGNINNLCGKTTLRQLAAILAKSKLYLGVDSGPAHIAATVNIPQVVIMGGGHFGRFIPDSSKTTLVYNQMNCYGCNWRCKYGQDIRCIKAITVDMVEWAVNSWLKTTADSFTQDQKTSHKQPEKEQYLVSAIISTYNSENFICGCLEDLENQTIANRLEIIVVNSGSQQNEEAIVKEFQQKYDNITYIKTEQRETIYKAWNRAIKAASGKYITNANTDDRHRQDALEIMARSLDENTDKVLVYTDQLEVNEVDGRRVTVGKRINGQFSRSRLFDGECPPGSQPMWRKEVHNVFGYFDESFAVGGDYEFWFRLTQRFDFIYLDEILGERYVGPETMSKSNTNLTCNLENTVIHKSYKYAMQEAITIGAEGISEHPIFSKWPEVNIWKQNTKAKLKDRQMSLVDNIKDIWDFRTSLSPKLTVVIVTYNRHKELLENLYALNEQNEKDFEVIVVDNSRDLSWLRQHTDEFKFGLCGVELEYNFGPSPARNIGAKFVKADYIAFLDDDVVSDKNLVRNIVEHFKNHNISGLRGKILPKNQAGSKDIPVNYDLGDQIITTACEVSCLAAFRKDVLVKTGGFDELLFGSEGMELSYRICKAQEEKVKSILYFADVVVYHNPRSKGPAQTEKMLRQDRMELLAHRKDNEITGYKELVHSLYPGNKAIFKENCKNYEWVINVAIYLQKNFPEEAVEWARKAVALDPDRFKGCYILGSLYTGFGRYDEALPLLERIYEPLRSSVINSGSEFINSEFKEQVDMSECYIKTCTQLAQCYIQNKQYNKVKQVYTDLLNNPNLTIPDEQKADIRNVLRSLDRISSIPAVTKNKAIVSAKSEENYLVSAIISTYNSEKFLSGCLEDLEQQTIADKLEIIVVNSSSQENEEAIVHEFQQKYDNIVYIKTEQREGIYSAWNRAVKVARGTFLTNANTDDRHRDDALEIMAETLLANPDAALVYGDQICTDTPNGTFADHHATNMAKQPEYSHERLLFGCCVGSQPMWCKTLHTELGYFDDTLTCAGDWDFWLRISSKYKFKHIPEFLGLYYYNENGIEHGRKIHSLYERYIVGKRHGNPYISVIPLYHSKGNPLVSVIMPAYNAADHIAEAVESVLIQNYRNFELIVVDDGSTDNTRNIVTSFKNDKIKCFYKDNGGPSGARNLAIKKAKGQYIMPLDSDDMMTPDFIARHLAEFEKHPDVDLVYSDVLLIDKNSTPLRIMNKPEYQDRRYLIRDLFRAGHPIVPFRLGIRRSVFEKIGFYDEDLLIGEDYDMMRRFVKARLKSHHLSEPLHLRRMRTNSLSGNFSAQKAKCHFEVIRRFTDTFTYDELFPDVAWDVVAPGIRQLHAKCLTAGTYLALGQEYIKSNALEYSRTAFDRACSELNDCIKMDPKNESLQQLLQKSKSIRARYAQTAQQAVTI